MPPARRRPTHMRPRLATIALAAAAAAAGAGVTARPASSHPVQIDPIAQLQAENARLRHRLDHVKMSFRILRDGLDDVDRINHRNRDRFARRAIDQALDDLRERAGVRDRDDDDRDYDDRDYDDRD